MHQISIDTVCTMYLLISYRRDGQLYRTVLLLVLYTRIVPQYEYSRAVPASTRTVPAQSLRLIVTRSSQPMLCENRRRLCRAKRVVYRSPQSDVHVRCTSVIIEVKAGHLDLADFWMISDVYPGPMDHHSAILSL